MFSLACWEYHTLFIHTSVEICGVREFRRLKTKASKKPDATIPLPRNLFFMVSMHRDVKFMLFKNTQHSFVLSLFCMSKSRLAWKLDVILLQPCQPPAYQHPEISPSSSKCF